jgi:hypothetical protein
MTPDNDHAELAELAEPPSFCVFYGLCVDRRRARPEQMPTRKPRKIIAHEKHEKEQDVFRVFREFRVFRGRLIRLR